MLPVYVTTVLFSVLICKTFLLNFQSVTELGCTASRLKYPIFDTIFMQSQYYSEAVSPCNEIKKQSYQSNIILPFLIIVYHYSTWNALRTFKLAYEMYYLDLFLKSITCYTWRPQYFFFKFIDTHIIFQKGVDNFEMEHKICTFLVRGAVPP